MMILGRSVDFEVFEVEGEVLVVNRLRRPFSDRDDVFSGVDGILGLLGIRSVRRRGFAEEELP